jgi:hypothetical protein
LTDACNNWALGIAEAGFFGEFFIEEIVYINRRGVGVI